MATIWAWHSDDIAMAWPWNTNDIAMTRILHGHGMCLYWSKTDFQGPWLLVLNPYSPLWSFQNDMVLCGTVPTHEPQPPLSAVYHPQALWWCPAPLGINQPLWSPMHNMAVAMVCIIFQPAWDRCHCMHTRFRFPQILIRSSHGSLSYHKSSHGYVTRYISYPWICNE